MTTRQKQLVENYIRLKVKNLMNRNLNLKEGISNGSKIQVIQDQAADESFKRLYGKIGKVIGKSGNFFIVQFGSKLKVLLTQDEIQPVN